MSLLPPFIRSFPNSITCICTTHMQESRSHKAKFPTLADTPLPTGSVARALPIMTVYSPSSGNNPARPRNNPQSHRHPTGARYVSSPFPSLAGKARLVRPPSLHGIPRWGVFDLIPRCLPLPPLTTQSLLSLPIFPSRGSSLPYDGRAGKNSRARSSSRGRR